MYPKKSETVHVEVLDDELCVYEWQRKEVHALNPTAALIWNLCDGQTSPGQMAEKVQTELGDSHAEDLVWATLDRLENARLLTNEFVRPVGYKRLTRRQMLKGLGVAVALLPVITSIVAPAPTAALSPTQELALTIYDAGVDTNGNLAGRFGADAFCFAQRPEGYQNARAFISVDADDTIRNMATNYNIPNDRPILSLTGVLIASSWADLIDKSINMKLQDAEVVNSEWWSGSNDDGSLSQNCNGWTDPDPNSLATVGSSNKKDADWMASSNTNCVDSKRRILCIAWS